MGQRGRGAPLLSHFQAVLWGLYNVGRSEREHRPGGPEADSGCIMKNRVSRERAGEPQARAASEGFCGRHETRALEQEVRASRSVAEGQQLDAP